VVVISYGYVFIDRLIIFNSTNDLIFSIISEKSQQPVSFSMLPAKFLIPFLI